MSKTIAITGGSGFIGKRLVSRHLELGHRVRVLSRRNHSDEQPTNLEWYRSDLSDPDNRALTRFVEGADILYHCAGEISDESTMDATNRAGTEHLAMIAAGHIGRWVQLSTAGVYGYPESGTITESSSPAPCNTYERSKLAADHAVLRISEAKGMPWSILRPMIVFGHDMPNNSIRALLRAIKSRRFFYIGPTGALLPYIHVDDVVQGLMLCGHEQNALYQTFNLSENILLEEFVGLVAHELGCPPPAMRLPGPLIRMCTGVLQHIPGFPLTISRIDALTRRVIYPSGRIVETLGYSPLVGWREGVRSMARTLNG